LIAMILLAIGLVLIIEGLVYALAPSLVEDLLDALRQIPVPQRRVFGLITLALGICLLFAANALGAF
jgi:uncharacterized protein YjeT (DUF2065 family)